MSEKRYSVREIQQIAEDLMFETTNESSIKKISALDLVKRLSSLSQETEECKHETGAKVQGADWVECSHCRKLFTYEEWRSVHPHSPHLSRRKGDRMIHEKYQRDPRLSLLETCALAISVVLVPVIIVLLLSSF